MNVTGRASEKSRKGAEQSLPVVCVCVVIKGRLSVLACPFVCSRQVKERITTESRRRVVVAPPAMEWNGGRECE